MKLAVFSSLLLLLCTIGFSIAAGADEGKGIVVGGGGKVVAIDESSRNLKFSIGEVQGGGGGGGGEVVTVDESESSRNRMLQMLPDPGCLDDPSFVFYYTNRKNIMKAKGGCRHVAKRRKRRCRKTMPDGFKVKYSCRATCNACPPKPPEPEPIVSGCEIKYLKLNIKNELDVTLYAQYGKPETGSQAVPGCNGCDNGETCTYSSCWTVSPGTTNSININSNGGCQGAEGTFTFGPSNPSYTTQTGLKDIVLYYLNGGGGNAKDFTFSQQFNVPNPKGYAFGDSSPTDTCKNSRKCDMGFTVKATAPATSAPISFKNYVGQWNFVGSGVAITVMAGTSWSNSESSTYGTSFTNGFTEGASAKFGPSSVSVGASQTMESTSSNTMTESNSGSTGITCGTPTCTGKLYQWSTHAVGSDGTAQFVQSCFFRCVSSSSPHKPRCPVGFCENNSCQCCNAPWIEGNDSATDNFLAPSAGGTCKPTCSSTNSRCTEDDECCSGVCEIGSGDQGNACY